MAVKCPFCGDTGITQLILEFVFDKNGNPVLNPDGTQKKVWVYVGAAKCFNCNPS